MTDLARSASEWKDGFFRKFALPLRLSRELVELRDRFREERIQVVNELDKNDNLTSVTLTGVKLGVNTSEDGVLYVRFVANSSNWDIQLFKASGGGGSDLVAHALNVANAGTSALTAQNSSGLGGSVTIATGTAEADDVHKLRVFPDWRKDAAELFDGSVDSITGDDSRSLFSFYDCLNDLGDLADDMLARVETYISEWMVSAPDNARSYGSEWLSSAETVLLSESTTTDSGGSVSRIRGGVLQDLALAMDSDSVGAQTLLRRLCAGAAGVADSTNAGSGSVGSHTPEGHARAGTYYLTCVAGLGTGDGGEERFRVSFASSVDDSTFTMSELLTVKQSYKGAFGFGPIVLERTFSKTGDVGSNTDLGAVTSGWSVTGESEDNTSSGGLWWKIVANGGAWTLSFYKASTLAEADKVAEVLSAATGASFTAREKNGSGLTVTGVIGSGPTTTTSGTLSLNFFSVQNSSNKPDRFTIAVTETSTGQGARIIADRLGYSLPGAASGETITDAMFKANTFTPYIVEDN